NSAFSGILGRDGRVIGQPLIDEDGVVYADLDLSACIQPRQMHDIVGHYNRFDVFDLRVNRKRLAPVRLIDEPDEVLVPDEVHYSVLGYACLLAIMSMGRGYHRKSERRLHLRTHENGGRAPVVTSAGALVDGLKAIGAKKVSLLAPYMKPLITK